MLALALVPLVAAATTVDPLPTSFDADAGAVHVSIKLLVAATERPMRVPIAIVATTSAGVAPPFVDVDFCSSWPCAAPETVHAAVGTSTSAQITLWPQGFVAHVRNGKSEGFARSLRNPTRVVALTTRATGGRGADLVHVQRNGADAGAVTAVFVGNMLREHR
jgi:hypothetical protein